MGTKNYGFTYINEPDHKRTDLVPETTRFLDQIDDALAGVGGKGAVEALGSSEEGGNVTVKGFNHDGEEVAQTTFAVGGSADVDIIAPLKTGSPAFSENGVAIGRGAKAEGLSYAIGDYSKSGNDAIAIGDYSIANDSSIAIGRDSATKTERDVVIGQQARGNAREEGAEASTGSVAIGALSTIEEDGIVSFGSKVVLNPFTRRIVNVSEPRDASDAATKSYVDSVSGGANSVSTIEVSAGSYQGSMVVTGRNPDGTGITESNFNYGDGFVTDISGSYDTDTLHLQANGVMGTVLSDISIEIPSGGGGSGSIVETVAPLSAAGGIAATVQADNPEESVAVGVNSTVTEAGGTAVGYNANAGSEATAVGNATATNGGVAIGKSCTATGNGGVSIGYGNDMEGTGAVIALGTGNAGNSNANGVCAGDSNIVKCTAAGYADVLIGRGCTGHPNGSIAIGDKITGARNSVTVGHGSGVTRSPGNYSASLGYNANASGASSTALGANATATGYGSIALGLNSTASSEHVLSVGSGYEGSSFPQPAYRRIVNVAEPAANHDAATKAYVDSKAGVVPALDSPTVVETFSYLALHNMPKWSNGSFRNGGWMVSNTASETKTITGGTVFATGMGLKPNQTASVLILPSGEENTLKTGDTGKSVFFSADFEIPANKTVSVMIMDEVF